MVAAFVPVLPETVTNLDAPKAGALQFETDGNALDVQVIPSDEVAAFAEPCAVAKNVLFPYPTPSQSAVAGSVLATQSKPFVEVAAAVPVVAETATKTPFP